MKKYILPALFFVAVLVMTIIDAPLDAQCAMCKASVETSNNASDLAQGLNSGILYLMSIPYVLIFGLGYFILRSQRRAKRA